MMKTNHTTTTALVVLAAVAATLLAAGTVAVASNHSAFAWKNKEYKNDKYQRDENNKYQNDGSEKSGTSNTLAQSVEQNCQTAGGTSPITGSCIATVTGTITNNGGVTPPPIPSGPCAGFVFDVHLREASGDFPAGTEICLIKPGENSPNNTPAGATIIPPGGTPLTGQTVRIDHAVGGNCPGGTHVDVDTGNPPDGFSLGEIACVTIST